MEGVTVQRVLQARFAEYAAKRNPPPYVRRAAGQLMQCRTEALGGHVKSCPNGHVHRYWFASCRHRSCPQCAAMRVEEWLAKQKARLLHCPHSHIIFTLDHELNDLWLYNRKELTKLFFRCVRDTLIALLADPQYLGAKPGIIAALHTWGSDLKLHVHIHCLVTAGGLAKDGSWRTPEKSCLLPRRAVMKLFRGKFHDRLYKAIDKGKLKPPPDRRKNQMLGLANKMGVKTWNVKVHDPYEHGKGVATYLARYMRGGPISNKRLVDSKDGQVTFDYRDNRDRDDNGRGTWKPMTLSTEQFIWRLVQHVPVPNGQLVRSYGLYANAKSDELATCRELLGQKEEEESPQSTLEEFWASLGEENPTCCPVCGAKLISHSEFKPGVRAPPLPLPLEIAA